MKGVLDPESSSELLRFYKRPAMNNVKKKWNKIVKKRKGVVEGFYALDFNLFF